MKEIKNTILFGQTTYKLMHLLRYNIYPRIFAETVAAHSYQVGILTLYLVKQLKQKIKINENKCFKMALIHDLGEINSVDVPHPIKEKYPALKTIIEDNEKNEVTKLLNKEYGDLLTEYSKCESIESIIVETSDVISCLIYAQEEIKLGNTNFVRVKKESEQRIKTLNIKLLNLVKNEKKN